MFHVYVLRSEKDPKQTYIGFTEDLRKRLVEHNDGKSTHTNKYKPWRVVAYFAFAVRARALAFEKYLKSGSGRAFAKGHFW